MQTLHISQKWQENTKTSSLRVWNSYLIAIKNLRKNFEVNLLAILIMPNHSHLIIKTKFPQEVLNSFQQIPGLDYPWSEEIKNFAQLISVYKYIHRNPLAGGLVSRVEDYPFSTISLLFNKSSQRISCSDPFFLICNPQRILEWLNDPSMLSPYYQTSIRDIAARYAARL